MNMPNMNPQLVVNYNKNLKDAPKIIFGYLFIFFLLSCYISWWNLGIYIRHFIVWYSILALPSTLYVYLLYYSKAPAMALYNEGIWTHNNGFIEWGKIKEIYTFQVFNIPVDSIGIRLKNNKSISGQSNFTGKACFFYSKLFDCPPIFLSSLDVSCDVIVNVAQQLLKNYQ